MDLDWLQSLLFSFKGRIGRQHWWLASLIVGVAILLSLSFIGQAARTSSGSTLDPALFEPSGVWAVASFAVSMLYTWISYALAAKRLHDRDRTGWWVAGPFMTAVIAAIFQGLGAEPVVWAVVIVFLAISLWLFIEIGFLKGTQGPNRYGPDPLAAQFDTAL